MPHNIFSVPADPTTPFYWLTFPKGASHVPSAMVIAASGGRYAPVIGIEGTDGLAFEGRIVSDHERSEALTEVYGVLRGTEARFLLRHPAMRGSYMIDVGSLSAEDGGYVGSKFMMSVDNFSMHRPHCQGVDRRLRSVVFSVDPVQRWHDLGALLEMMREQKAQEAVVAVNRTSPEDTWPQQY